MKPRTERGDAAPRVLIVDDERSIRRTLGEFLRGEGYEVAEAEDVDAARQHLKDAPFDVVVSDIILPRITGLELMKSLRASNPEVKVVMMTGEPTVETATESIRQGATDYLFKPITKTVVQRVVANAIKLKTLEDAQRRLEAENRTCQEGLERLVAERTRQLEYELTERKMAEQALRQSEALYESLVNQLPQCVFRKDQAGRFTFGNQRFCERVGREPQDLPGLTDFDLFPPEMAEGYHQDDLRIMASGESWTDIELHRSPGAETDRSVEVVKWPLYTTEGQVTGVQGIFWDVTERECAIKALCASEARLNEAQRLAHLGSWEAEPGSPDDPSSGTLTWSDETFRLFGYEPGVVEVTNELFKAGVHPEDWPRVQAAAMEALARHQPYRVEHRVVRPDGSERLVLEQAEVVCDPASGRPVRLVGTVQDVTDQRRAEEQLRKLARAVEQSPASILITDREGNIEFVNPKFAQVSGYSAEELVGKTPRILKSGGTSPEEYRQLWRRITAGEEWHGEFHNKRKDGTLFWESASISSIRDASGTITHFIGVKEDITEKKLTELKLLRAQRVESIGSLASGIAHDLNNILTPIIMCAPLIDLEDSPENRRELTRTIESSGQRAAGIVRQLLSFARGKEGQKVTLQVRHLIRDMAKIAREVFPRNIQVEEICAPDLWPVVSDATQLHQVLLNLCVNARDAMPHGGTLTLRADNVTLDEHFASMNRDASPGSFVRLQVADTGTGIPDAVRDRIFDSFFTTKEEGQGTGLGLTTVLGIVRDHKGFLRFTTTPGQGTTFDIHLPAVPEAPSRVETNHLRRSSPRGHGERVLVVDDEPIVRAAARRTLEQHDYGVLEAHDGIQALALFSQHQVEIRAVVTDFMMPLMDGVTLCRTLRTLSPNLAIIVSSGGLFGRKGSEALQTFNELGIRHILHKPHNADDLLRTLDSALQPVREAATEEGGS